MTAVAAVVQRGRIWVGADSAGSSFGSLTIRADEKVFQVGEYLYGICGSFRLRDLLRYSFDPPKRVGRDLDRFMATTYINALRHSLSDGGFLKKEHNVEEIDASFIVGIRGSLYTVESDLQVGRVRDDYCAVGSGADVCLGALAAGRSAKPRERVLTALRASEHHITSVRGPFVVISNAEGVKK